MPSVRIIIVNYRTADLTIGCLRSLAPHVQNNSAMSVVVVDNSSNDESEKRICAAIEKDEWADWVRLRELTTNGGFAVGNNAALREALRESPAPDFFWLLNSDTIVRSGALDALCAFMQAHSAVGIAGSRLEDNSGTVQCSAFRFPSILGELEDGLRWGWATRLLARWRVAQPAPSKATRADWVSGASMFVRREVFEAIDLLDEQFFMYFEDIDFCRRAARAGWECWYVPSSRVVHWGGQSSGMSNTRHAPARRPAYWFAARQTYFFKHHGRVYRALADTAWLLGFGLWRVRLWLQRKPDRDPPQLWHDFLQHSLATRGLEN